MVARNRQRDSFPQRKEGFLMLGANRPVLDSFHQHFPRPIQRLESSPSRTEGVYLPPPTALSVDVWLD
jgi:hypothetical protein